MHFLEMSLFREYCVTLDGRWLCGLGNDCAKVKQMQLSFAICIGSVDAYTFNLILIWNWNIYSLTFQMKNFDDQFQCWKDGRYRLGRVLLSWSGWRSLENYRKTCLVYVSSCPINYLPFDRWRLSPSRNSEFCASWKSALGHSSLNITSRSFMCGLGFLSRGFYLGSWVFVLIKYTQNTSLMERNTSYGT